MQQYYANYSYPPGVDPYPEEKKRQKKELFQIGSFVGAALLAFLMLQNFVVILMMIFGLYDKYRTDALVQTGIEILSSVFCILLPFTFFGKIISKRYTGADILPLEKPKDTVLRVLSVPFGVGLCMAANIVTSYLIVFMNAFGVTLSSPEMLRAEGFSGFLISVVQVSVAAAVVEEISLRGSVMQNLRKYGDTFAVVMSAVVFGIMHMNLVQAPFAVIVGLGLGFITVKTGSMWPAIIVHAINNFFSTVITYLPQWGVNEKAVNIIYSLALYAFLGLGVVFGYFFIRRAGRISAYQNSGSVLTAGEKAKAFLLSPTIIIAMLVMLYYTAQYVGLTQR
ncbi:MAG: lysostaphin resistance A-like protein [Acutalibacteraceae bacterium]